VSTTYTAPDVSPFTSPGTAMYVRLGGVCVCVSVSVGGTIETAPSTASSMMFSAIRPARDDGVFMVFAAR